MRYSRCEEYLNIYSENPTQVSLIIIKSLDDPEKIIEEQYFGPIVKIENSWTEHML
jgi:hypothetical protein